jgi:dipeptide/tripeptide permease
MSVSQRLQEIRDGFERPFWVANISEIFERLSYYGAFASLALYLQEKLNFSTEQTGALTGLRRHGLVPCNFRRRRGG